MTGQPWVLHADLADAAVSLLDGVEREWPVRLLGVRLEMTEPSGD